VFLFIVLFVEMIGAPAARPIPRAEVDGNSAVGAVRHLRRKISAGIYS